MLEQFVTAFFCALGLSLFFLAIHRLLAATIFHIWADATMIALSVSVLMICSFLLTKTLAQKREMEKISIKDSLTGLYNRRFLEMQREAIEEQARRTGFAYGVAMIDLNNLKPINDTFGHATGDRLLRKTADILKGIIRKNDLAFRLGGDEFMIIWFSGKEDSFDSLEERLREALENFPFRERGVDIIASASLGIAVCTDATKNSLEDVMHVADMCMYREKESRKR